MSCGALHKLQRRRRYQKWTKVVFCTNSKKGLENWSSRFEPKISLISFSRGSGPPLNCSCLIAAEQHAYCSRGKINFWPHLGEERPEKPQNFHGNPSRSRIESIKSAGKKSQKVILITCPRHFLETLISCRIYIPKNAILQGYLPCTFASFFNFTSFSSY